MIESLLRLGRKDEALAILASDGIPPLVETPSSKSRNIYENVGSISGGSGLSARDSLLLGMAAAYCQNDQFLEAETCVLRCLNTRTGSDGKPGEIAVPSEVLLFCIYLELRKGNVDNALLTLRNRRPPFAAS